MNKSRAFSTSKAGQKRNVTVVLHVAPGATDKNILAIFSNADKADYYVAQQYNEQGVDGRVYTEKWAIK